MTKGSSIISALLDAGKTGGDGFMPLPQKMLKELVVEVLQPDADLQHIFHRMQAARKELQVAMAKENAQATPESGAKYV